MKILQQKYISTDCCLSGVNEEKNRVIQFYLPVLWCKRQGQ